MPRAYGKVPLVAERIQGEIRPPRNLKVVFGPIREKRSP